MKKSRFTERQIVGVLKQPEAGVPVKDLCRKIGISDQTFYNWKAKYGGLSVSELKRLRELGSGERAAKEDVRGSGARERGDQSGFESKAVTPSDRREAAKIMVKEHRVSIARACRVAKLSRAAYYRQGIDWAKRDAPVVDALNGVVEQHRRWGFWKCFDRLHNQGHWWNPKRVYRVYCRLGLNLPRRAKKRLPPRLRQPLTVAAAVNAVWALDFMSDSLWSGRRFRVLNVLDEGVREGLAIEVDTRLPAKRAVRVLDRLAELRGLPGALRMDNGPEPIAQELLDWCERNDVEPRHIQPGKPNQNAYVERYNRGFRNEVLDAYVFDDLEQVRELSAEWLQM